MLFTATIQRIVMKHYAEAGVPTHGVDAIYAKNVQRAVLMGL